MVRNMYKKYGIINWVHSCQDHLLIDIDSGDILLHLKAETTHNFHLWVNALQSHAESKVADLELNANQSFNSTTESSDISFSDIDNLNIKCENMITSLNKELLNLKDVIDTSRSRFDSKSQWRGKFLFFAYFDIN